MLIKVNITSIKIEGGHENVLFRSVQESGGWFKGDMPVLLIMKFIPCTQTGICQVHYFYVPVFNLS